jgi:hypothetical protein
MVEPDKLESRVIKRSRVQLASTKLRILLPLVLNIRKHLLLKFNEESIN